MIKIGSGNWIVDNLNSALETWNGKLAEIRDISFRTYYRRRKEAVAALSSVLWGYTTQDNLDILELFFPSASGS